MLERYFYTIVRITMLSLMGGYQVADFFFWHDDIFRVEDVMPLKFSIPIIIAFFIFPIVVLPLLLALNLGIPRWKMTKEVNIEPPSFNADMFDLSRPLNQYQDASYFILAFALPNFILYLIFKSEFTVSIIPFSVGIGMLIAVQITLRIFRGKY